MNRELLGILLGTGLLILSARADDSITLERTTLWSLSSESQSDNTFFLFSDEENPKLQWKVTGATGTDYELVSKFYRVLSTTAIPLNEGVETKEIPAAAPGLSKGFESTLRIPKSESPIRYLIQAGVKQRGEESTKISKNLFISQVTKGEIKSLFDEKLFDLESPERLPEIAAFINKFGGKLSTDAKGATHRIRLFEKGSDTVSIPDGVDAVTVLIIGKDTELPKTLEATEKIKIVPMSLVASLSKSSDAEIALAKYLLERPKSKK